MGRFLSSFFLDNPKLPGPEYNGPPGKSVPAGTGNKIFIFETFLSLVSLYGKLMKSEWNHNRICSGGRL